MLIVGGSGFEKANALLNLINNEPDTNNFFYILKIHTKQNINFWLKYVKMLEQSILMILKFLLNTQIIWVTFIKTLKNTAYIKNGN